jgi:glucose-6-phosphate 1-dehydrogenase
VAQEKDQARVNPLREGIVTRSVPEACTVVIFGATGDLTHRKLIPALYNIAADGELPPQLTVVGMARREKTDDAFRAELGEAVRKHSRQTVRDEVWDGFAKSIFYHMSDFGDA